MHLWTAYKHKKKKQMRSQSGDPTETFMAALPAA